jgi:hypothetical protein
MAKSRTAVVESADQEIMIAIPIGGPPEAGYEAKQAQAGKLSLSQPTLHIQAQLGTEAATAFLRIRNGLRSKNAKLCGGRPVWTNVDALRWIMEQVSAEVA